MFHLIILAQFYFDIRIASLLFPFAYFFIFGISKSLCFRCVSCTCIQYRFRFPYEAIENLSLSVTELSLFPLIDVTDMWFQCCCIIILCFYCYSKFPGSFFLCLFYSFKVPFGIWKGLLFILVVIFMFTSFIMPTIIFLKLNLLLCGLSVLNGIT